LERLGATETRNPASREIDSLATIDLVRLMNAEDAGVAAAVATQVGKIAEAIDRLAPRVEAGGRLIYTGAGTSGRLGVLDATECPPTFSAPPEMVVGLIAGGPPALTRAVEGAEDRPELALADLAGIEFRSADTLVGIASSGRTPYVLAGLDRARELGAFSIAVVCNADSEVARRADLAIEPIVGPEVLTGSTRLKAGTATKMVLNMLSTGLMVRLGKTYGNLMVDLRATNVKLKDRARRIVATLTGLSVDDAGILLDRYEGEVKLAILGHLLGLDPPTARARLGAARGRLRAALDGTR
jgi:N-acetylmuramic acid 6-phosphate etherase